MKDYILFQNRDGSEEPLRIKLLQDVRVESQSEQSVIFSAACPCECEEGMLPYLNGDREAWHSCPTCQNDNRIVFEIEQPDLRIPKLMAMISQTKEHDPISDLWDMT